VATNHRTRYRPDNGGHCLTGALADLGAYDTADYAADYFTLLFLRGRAARKQQAACA
jgi:hypothetical protein